MLKIAPKYKRLLKPFKNLFFLIFMVFVVWMLFFDGNSWFIHSELNDDIEKLESEKTFYSSEINKDKKDIKNLSNEEGVEKYGREKYKMKKENEEIYIIEYEDSLKTKNKNE